MHKLCVYDGRKNVWPPWTFSSFLLYCIPTHIYVIHTLRCFSLSSPARILFSSSTRNVLVLYEVRQHVCQQAYDVDAKLLQRSPSSTLWISTRNCREVNSCIEKCESGTEVEAIRVSEAVRTIKWLYFHA